MNDGTHKHLKTTTGDSDTTDEKSKVPKLKLNDSNADDLDVAEHKLGSYSTILFIIFPLALHLFCKFEGRKIRRYLTGPDDSPLPPRRAINPLKIISSILSRRLSHRKGAQEKSIHLQGMKTPQL
ncbi:hypothetical protein JTB14_004883 [Gonioctena quinquepunctata]|nr:hypothetical protein JTB14_004883 [Gonioctena quinquepunctata]